MRFYEVHFLHRALVRDGDVLRLLQRLVVPFMHMHSGSASELMARYHFVSSHGVHLPVLNCQHLSLNGLYWLVSELGSTCWIDDAFVVFAHDVLELFPLGATRHHVEAVASSPQFPVLEMT